MKKGRETEQSPLAGTEEGEILTRLTERVEKAVSVIQDLRRERQSLKEKLANAEKQLGEHQDAGSRVTVLEEENQRFTKERGEIRNRIEKVLSSLESLDSTE